MLEIQKLLLEQGLDTLTPLAIKYKPHPKYPELILFKYDQRLSPMSEPAVQDARGIILNKDDDWKVISMSFRKFFNLEEGHAAQIDWQSAVIEEKVDGSLMQLYFYDGWQVASSGTPDAGGLVVQNIKEKQNITYRELFWQTFEQLGYQLPTVETPYTFAFELMTPLNRVVVDHKESRLPLIGVRNLMTLEEEDPIEWAKKLGYQSVQTYRLPRENLRQEANKIPAMQGEGFVVRDRYFNRIKVKSEQYVKVSLVREQWSERRAALLILSGEESEFGSYFPEYKTQLQSLKAAIDSKCQEADAFYQSLRHLENQKKFAIQATKHPWSGALFAMRQGKVENSYQWLLGLSENAKFRALNM